MIRISFTVGSLENGKISSLKTNVMAFSDMPSLQNWIKRIQLKVNNSIIGTFYYGDFQRLD